MKKRLFAIMLALAMLLVAVPALAEEGEGEHSHDGESAPTYVDNKDGTHTVTYGCGETKTVKHTFNDDGKCVCGAQGPIENAVTVETEKEKTEVTKATQEVNEEKQKDIEQKKRVGNQEENNVPKTEKKEEGPTQGTSQVANSGADTPNSENPGGSNENANNNNNSPGCDHANVTYEQYNTVDEGRYTYHKKKCLECDEDWKEFHQWDETTEKPKTEGNNIPTCTSDGHWTKECKLCHHVTVFDVPALGHDYGDPTWNWCGVSSATATFKCKRDCKEKNAIVTRQARPTRSGINNCGYYTYTATVEFNDNTYTDTRTDYSCRPDWYYDPCYYNNPCGHWGCGNVCTRYSDCVPCQNYRTTFRVGGYNCLATPKTGDASVIAPAMLALIGAAGVMLGKKRR